MEPVNPARRCPACGHVSSALDLAAACARCPLTGGCSLVCCPACLHTDVDVRTSRVAGWLGALLSRRPAPTAPGVDGSVPLTSVPERSEAVIREFDQGMDPGHRQRLQGLGVIPGRTVEVVRQARVTVFRVESTELAVEREVSDRIRVRLLPAAALSPP